MPDNRKRTGKSTGTKTIRTRRRTRTTHSFRTSSIRAKRIAFTSVQIPAQATRSKLFTFFDWISSIPVFARIIRSNIQHLSRSRRIGILFLVLGVLLISFPYLTRFFTQVSADEIPIRADETFSSSPTVEKSPIRIIIPSLEIDLPIAPSRLVRGYWEVSETTASFGLGSAAPGNIGNTVIFAHAREGLFLPLKNITFGKDIYVLNPDKWYQYRVDEIREVLPTDVYVVNRTADNRLTLFTCSGFLDSKRLVVIAKPVE